jgi:DNA-binding XRE family transcriptional regulator
VKNEVRALRLGEGASQKQLAEALGVSRQTVNSIETGRYDPSLPLAIVVGLLLRAHAPGGMGNGFLQGAAISLVAAAVMAWRVSRRRGTTFERAWTRTGDERDDAVLTRSLAVLGLLTLPATGIATVAIALGAGTAMVLALLLGSQVAILGVAFAAISRRS